MGVLIHVIGDALNNIGVIIAGLVIWRGKFDGRFYADPGVSMGTAVLILLSAIPLGKPRLCLRTMTQLTIWLFSQEQRLNPTTERTSRS
jgi:Co/Zn/Cd efflux system component